MFAEIGDPGAAKFEFGGDTAGLFDAVTEEVEEALQAALAVQEGGEMGFGGFEAGKGFFFKKDRIGMAERVGGDQFDGIREMFVVVNLDWGEILGIGEDEVFFAMMEASDVSQDETFELMEDDSRLYRRRFGSKRVSLSVERLRDRDNRVEIKFALTPALSSRRG